MSKVPEQNADTVLDTLGLYCPVPIWEAAKQIRDMSNGQVIQVISDDEQIVDDMPAWCSRTGNQYLGLKRDGPEIHLFVRKHQS